MTTHIKTIGRACTLTGFLAAAGVAHAFDLTARVRAAGAATVALEQGEAYNESSYPISNAVNGDAAPSSSAGRVLIKTNPTAESPVVIAYDIDDGYAGSIEVSSVKLIISSDANGIGRAPKFYALQAQREGSSAWTTLAEVTEENIDNFDAWSATGRTRTHDVQVPNRFPSRHYRFVCTANNGSADSVHFSFTELILGGSYRISAPAGVGDVVTLTNVIRQLTDEYTADARNGEQILLDPGVYDLSGFHMTPTSHLELPQWPNGLFSGLGGRPSDTVLLGGGPADAHRVINNAGGGNYAYLTISNLTVTGGYLSSGDGGGIQSTGTTVYRNLVVSNNYAFGSNGGGGGGCMRGRAFDCLFVGNRTEKNGGAFYDDGKVGLLADVRQGAWGCTFTDNSAFNGGAVRSSGVLSGCTFERNAAKNGGAVYGTSDANGMLEIYDSEFTTNSLSAGGNYYGAALYCGDGGLGVLASNCTFSANIVAGGHGVVDGANLADCTVVSNCDANPLIRRSNARGCLFADNRVTSSDGCLIVGASESAPATNVNCIVAGNILSGFGRVLEDVILVNCTVVGNEVLGGDNYGGIFRRSPAWNTVFSANRIAGQPWDVRGDYLGFTDAIVMTNCLYTVARGSAENFQTNACVQADMAFADDTTKPYLPSARAKTRNAGAMDGWLLALVGESDFYGRTRIFDGTIDIGAVEVQERSSGLMVIFR